MKQFERTAQRDIFVEDSDIVPIIIKYTDLNERGHNEHNDTTFSQAIKDCEGIHTCVFLNNGVSKGKNARNQFLIYLEDAGRSIRTQVDTNCRSFFGCYFVNDNPVVPNDSAEYVRRRCNIRFVDWRTDEIDTVNQMQWLNRLSELMSIIQSISKLKRPLKEIRKEEDQAIWLSYAEGLEALTKAKQELRRISKVGEIHTEKNRRKENISVINLEIVSKTNAEDFRDNISEVLEGHAVKPIFKISENGKECTLEYEGFRVLSEDKLNEFVSIAEQSCFKIKTPQPLHFLTGEFRFKSSDLDNEFVISKFDARLSEYDQDYPKKTNNQYAFSSDSDAKYARDLVQQHFGTILKCTTDTNLVISFMKNVTMKSVSKDIMKSLARDLGGEPSLRINTAIGKAYCTPLEAADYEDIKNKIDAIVPDSILVLYPDYKPTMTISFLNEDPDYKQESFERIESALQGLPCEWSLKGDSLHFSLAFDEEGDRDTVVERMQKVESEYSQLFDLLFYKPKGITNITFCEDEDLRIEYEKNLRSDFGCQEVRLIPSSYGDIKEEIKKAEIKGNRDAQNELINKKEELISKAEKIGTCISRTLNSVKIEVCESFIEKLDDEEISIAPMDYIQFPLIGEATNISRQKAAMDRILRPGRKNRYGKIIPSASNPGLSNFLFDPRYATETESDIESVKSQIQERQIESNMNERQREAVAKAIEAKDVAFIQGPPGTGKTTVIAEIIWQEVLRNPSCRILLTSQTNTAVDNALERLQGKRGIRPIRIPKVDGEERMVREGRRYLISQLKSWNDKPTKENSDNAINLWVDTILNEMDASEKYSQVIARWRKDLTEKDQFVRKTFAESYLRNVNLVAATCSICGSRSFGEVYQQLYGSSDMIFDVVIMDEASKATPLEMAIPMVLGRKIILIGDHKQLPPMIDDDEVKEALTKIGKKDLVDKLDNIKESQFKRLFESCQKMRPTLVSTLDTQYRMHKQIMNCITHFYKDDIEGGLKCGIESSMDLNDWDNRGSRYHGLDNPPFINPDVHAIWVDVDGKEEKVGHSPYNRAELKAIEKILNTIRDSKGYEEFMSHCTRPEDEEIGIITFYGAQVKELQRMYKEGKFGPGKYKIDVVDSFQGMERNIVIVSTVRTDRIGFAKAIERINVAFSRAKRLLIVVGDKDFFAQNANYRTSIQAMEVIDIKQLS